MTLLGAILKKVKSTDSISRKYASPPPELEEVLAPRKRKSVYKYANIPAKVDASVPHYAPGMLRALLASQSNFNALYADNLRLVMAIKKAHFRGRVDNRWDELPPGSKQYYERRANFLQQTQAVNKQMYTRIVNVKPRVVRTASLLHDWRFNRSEMIRRAHFNFVLFPAIPTELAEDPAFLPPAGVKRPRVHLTLRTDGCAVLGELVVELFTDVCPRTCGLFVELLDGDQHGYGYVGTKFFRKVPGLLWSGGDVIYDNGCGCYAQCGRTRPIGAENLHFSHSMPGLVSMRVTRDDEMCGIFNITFKRLPQLDLRNEVFGRVVRPSATYDSMLTAGAGPAVRLDGARRRVRGHWVRAATNTRITTHYRPLNK